MLAVLLVWVAVELTGNTAGLPVSVRTALMEIGAAAGADRLHVTSTTRTAQEQASAIIDYYIECGQAPARRAEGVCGVDLALRVYDPACHPGIDLYRPPSEQTRSETIRQMGAAIAANLTRLGPARGCMRHVASGADGAHWYAIDIAPSSVADPAAFYDAVTAHPAVIAGRFLHPPITGRPPSPVPDSAFHIEFRIIP